MISDHTFEHSRSIFCTRFTGPDRKWALLLAFALVTCCAQAALTETQREHLLKPLLDPVAKKPSTTGSPTAPATANAPSAGTTATASAESQTEKEAAEQKSRVKKKAEAAVTNSVDSLNAQLAGFGFGAGLAVLNLNGSRPVESIHVDDTNTVRIATKGNMRVGAIFETHWLFEELPFTKPKNSEDSPPNQRTVGESVVALHQMINASDGAVPPVVPEVNVVRRHISAGPMFTAEIGDNAIRSLGLGGMISLQHYRVGLSGEVTPHGVAFNVGFIVFAEPNVKTVKGSFTDGQVVPAGTIVGTEDEDRFGVGLVFSTNF